MNAPLPLLSSWATRRSQPITIFDLETTTNNPYVDWLGITEVALITLFPSGEIREECSLVDPERNIPPVVRELTGITNADVRGKPTWAAWAQKLHEIAQRHLVIGYNSAQFDCVVVSRQNERYGIEGTAFAHSLDARALPGVSGTLTAAAAQLGLSSDTAHRALADAWLTARLVEKVAERDGAPALEPFIGARPAFGKGYSPRGERADELRRHLAENGTLPDLDEMAARHSIKRSTLEGDVIRLIETGEASWTLLANATVQAYLEARLEEAIAATWIGEAEGRLKPLMTFLEPEAPAGLDYTQLKVGLARRREATEESVAQAPSVPPSGEANTGATHS